VFAAKQPFEAPKASGSKKAVFAIIGIALLAVLAGGAYVWYEINKSPGPIARAPMAPTPVKPAAAAPATPPAETVAAAAAGAEGKPDPAKGDGVPPVSTLKPGSVAAKAKPQPKAAEQLVMSLLKDSPRAAKAAPPLKLDKKFDLPRVAPEVSQGYDALRSGDLATARKAYEAAVAADATGLDAHLGLATVAARTGDRTTAMRHYRRALELDPKNPSAVAGLASLADFSRPDVLEAQLRADLTRYPASAPLHYTLGNLYAAQSRWNEAQAAYFEAYRLDPETADIAYNLAVSLDHLGQSRLAADFYQRALAASGKQDVQFDKGQVSRRLAELKP
jgi:tetratricopeptide (TPR) repeat protein